MGKMHPSVTISGFKIVKFEFKVLLNYGPLGEKQLWPIKVMF